MKKLTLFGSPCSCHGKERLIVLSRKNDFITQNCVISGNPSKIQLEERFLHFLV